MGIIESLKHFFETLRGKTKPDGGIEKTPDLANDSIPLFLQNRIDYAKQTNAITLDLSVASDWDDKYRLKELPAEVLAMTALVSINLSGNRIAVLPPNIADLSNLTTLDLSNNNIQNMPAGLKTIASLSSVVLANNEISEIPDWFALMASLTALDLRHNNISLISHSLSQMSNLRTLYIDGDIGLTRLEHLKNLTTLTLYDKETNQIPIVIQKLPNLKVLTLQCEQGKRSMNVRG